MAVVLQVRAELHRRWRHVLVDEGQDTNLCQFELVRQITGPNSKLFMVGDPDQVRDMQCCCLCWCILSICLRVKLEPA